MRLRKVSGVALSINPPVTASNSISSSVRSSNVPCRRFEVWLVLLMIFSIKPANGPIRSPGAATLAHRSLRRCEPVHHQHPNQTFRDGHHSDGQRELRRSASRPDEADQCGGRNSLRRAANASKASTAAMRSPYAAGTAKAAGNSGATTPFTRNASPTKRKRCKRRRGRKASTRAWARSSGQKY